MLAGEGWHPGVIGIVASRLVERHRRPVVLVALDGDRGRGSGRGGCEAFDLLAGLTACAEHLSRYGGHRAAAGLEIERERVVAFAAALGRSRRRAVLAGGPAPVERVDAVVTGAELGMALAEELAGLAPFGQANPPVSLMIGDATFADVRPMGEGKHVRFTVRVRRRARPRGRVRQRRAPAGGRGRGRPRDIHAGGQRVERRERAATGAAPRAPGGRAADRGSPASSDARAAGRLAGARAVRLM